MKYNTDIKWNQLTEAAAFNIGGLNVETMLFSANIWGISKYGIKNYLNATVSRSKNKRTTVVKVSENRYIVRTEAVLVIPQEDHATMIRNGWEYKGRNLWEFEYAVSPETMSVISKTFERLKDVDVEKLKTN